VFMCVPTECVRPPAQVTCPEWKHEQCCEFDAETYSAVVCGDEYKGTTFTDSTHKKGVQVEVPRYEESGDPVCPGLEDSLYMNEVPLKDIAICLRRVWAHGVARMSMLYVAGSVVTLSKATKVDDADGIACSSFFGGGPWTKSKMASKRLSHSWTLLEFGKMQGMTDEERSAYQIERKEERKEEKKRVDDKKVGFYVFTEYALTGTPKEPLASERLEPAHESKFPHMRHFVDFFNSDEFAWRTLEADPDTGDMRPMFKFGVEQDEKVPSIVVYPAPGTVVHPVHASLDTVRTDGTVGFKVLQLRHPTSLETLGVCIVGRTGALTSETL